MKHNIVRLAILVAILTLSGCDSDSSSDHVFEIVVESYQIASEPLQPVWVTRTADIDGTYHFEQTAVNDAQVAVFLLDEAGNRADRFDFERNPQFPGEYRVVGDHEVMGGKTYELEVIPASGQDIITSTTVVPEDLTVISRNANRLPYAGNEQFEFNVTRSQHPDRQTIFIFSIKSIEPSIQNLTPFYLDAIYEIGKDEPYNPDELDVDELTEVLINSSPPINEGNYDQLPDGSLTIQLPWFAVAFFGETDVTVNAIDDNLYDFIRYQQVQQGGSSLSPGEIPNVLDRVENGRGLFSSMARTTDRVFVEREEGD